MTEGRFWVKPAAWAVALMLLGAACAKSSPPTASGAGYGSGGGGDTPAASPTGGSGGSTKGGYGYGSGGGGGGDVAPGSLEQGAGGFTFSPSTLTVKKGDTLTVKNVGSVPHTFTIDGEAIDVVNQPGDSQKVKIGLAPGTYTFVCTYHQSLGMTGTITVE